MTRDLLFPMHLDAHVVATGTASPVADLAGEVFGAAPPLEPGIHLHWALPDALTQASTEGDNLRFPAVPDRWLVVRIAPSAGTGPRATRAWIVDAIEGTTTALAAWTAGPALPAGVRLTVMGALEHGRLRIDDSMGENRAIDCVYYPRARDRFGFHDRLDGVDRGTLSYLVVGWYGDAAHDPLRFATATWSRERHLIVDDAPTGARIHTPILRSNEQAPGRAGVPRPPDDLIDQFVRGRSIDPSVAAVVAPVFVGDHAICHGAVVAVPWQPADAPTPPAAEAQVYGSIHEAAERVFADQSGEAWMRDAMAVALGRGDGDGASSYLATEWHSHAGGFIARLGEPSDAPGSSDAARSSDAPRFFRPDAPAVVISGLPRTLRHGEDADLDPERKPGQPGAVRLRSVNQIVTGVRMPIADNALADSLLVGASGLADPVSSPGIPYAVPALLDEVMLRDPANRDALAARLRDAHAARRRNADPSVTIDTDPSVTIEAARAAATVALAAWSRLAVPAHVGAARTYFAGTPPMAFALKTWAPEVRPLYAELSVSFTPTPNGTAALPPGWTLGPIDLEPPLAESAASVEPSGVRFTVRRVLTPVVPRILGSATNSVEARELALLACALPEIEHWLPYQTIVRAGRLALHRLRVVDTFGQSYEVAVPLSRELPPRLTGWARLHVRLRGGDAIALDADDTRSPVCGFVVADRVDHAVELFDATGRRVGQVRHVAGEATAEARWEPDPLRAAIAAQFPASDPARVLGAADPDAVLLAIARGLLAAPTVGRATAVSALLDAIDLLQPTVARSAATDEAAALLGRPLAIVRAAVRLERLDPATESPDLPSEFATPLALGAIARTDDGVFGYFQGAEFSRFLPVDADAVRPRPVGGAAPRHPYVADSPVITLAGPAEVLVTLLVDPRHHVHARVGVLPAKRISLPASFYEPSLRALSPSIRVGPVLVPPSRPWLPAPAIPATEWRWLHVLPGTPAGAPLEEPLAMPGAGESLPERVPVAQEGSLRLVRVPPKTS